MPAPTKLVGKSNGSASRNPHGGVLHIFQTLSLIVYFGQGSDTTTTSLCRKAVLLASSALAALGQSQKTGLKAGRSVFPVYSPRLIARRKGRPLSLLFGSPLFAIPRCVIPFTDRLSGKLSAANASPIDLKSSTLWTSMFSKTEIWGDELTCVLEKIRANCRPRMPHLYRYRYIDLKSKSLDFNFFDDRSLGL